MLFWLIPLIIGVILLVLFLIFRVKEKRVIAVILKGLTSLCFIATAIVAWKTSNNPNTTFGIFVILALFFGLLGDVFLDIKYITKDFLFTVLGFIAFGIGHIFSIVGLFIHFYDYESSSLYLIIPIIFSVIATVFTLMMEKFTAIKYGKLKPFAVGYGLILFFVMSLYFSIAIQHNWQLMNINIMAIGLILFALSDLILNNTYFSTGCNTPLFVISNHVVYFIAQFAIAVSLFFLI